MSFARRGFQLGVGVLSLLYSSCPSAESVGAFPPLSAPGGWGQAAGAPQTLVLGAGGCCCLHVKLRDGNVSVRRVRG